MMRVFIALILAGVALTAAAHADCEDGVAALAPKLAGVSDPHVHALVEQDLRQAQYELWEFDEVECAQALAHANRLLSVSADEARLIAPLPPFPK